MGQAPPPLHVFSTLEEWLLNWATRGVNPLAQACTKWFLVLFVSYTTLGLIFAPKVLAVHCPNWMDKYDERMASMRQVEHIIGEQRKQRAHQGTAAANMSADHPANVARQSSSGAAASPGVSRFSQWRETSSSTSRQLSSIRVALPGGDAAAEEAAGDAATSTSERGAQVEVSQGG